MALEKAFDKIVNLAAPTVNKIFTYLGFNTGPSRPMKYPYTFTAKIVQFPYKFHIKHGWMYRYSIYGMILSLPIFAYLSKLSNSPENKAKWAEIRRKELEGH